MILSIVLSIANKRLYVYEDPRIGTVSDMLPQTNCGACGEPGCRAFAEAIVAGSKAPNQCTVSSAEQVDDIAAYLGVELGEVDRKVARLACAGGTNVARQATSYVGNASCRSAALVAGGGKGCVWGCLGLGDCAAHCEFGAITMNEHSLPVVDAALCTACGDCVDVCPKDLFELVSLSNHLWVACKNQLADEDATRDCEVACTGCGLCASDAAPGLIAIQNNLANVNHTMVLREDIAAIDRCPTGAITWLDRNSVQKGSRAKKIVRQSPLPQRGA
ncbi:MAG: RnfABCDGE type electron transport complex subunit B [Leptospiraceae bacterium]|nr:RnfABCDGE type electron transport complex subunit B [Leptospiraceae bacterium]